MWKKIGVSTRVISELRQFLEEDGKRFPNSHMDCLPGCLTTLSVLIDRLYSTSVAW